MKDGSIDTRFAIELFERERARQVERRFMEEQAASR
jgi:hypothetical protein